MLTILLLMAFASMIDNLNMDYPLWGWAVAYAVCSALLHLLFGGGFALIPLFIISMIVALYAWGYFNALAYLKGRTALWLIVYAVGAVLPALIGI